MTGASLPPKSLSDKIGCRDALKIGFLAISAKCLLLGLVFWGVVYLFEKSDKQPMKWPTPTRDCVAGDGRLRTDAELLDLAIEIRDKKNGVHNKAYNEHILGGPVLRDQSTVVRVNTVPNDGKVYTVSDLDSSDSLSWRYGLAKRGIRQYAAVGLKFKAPIGAELRLYHYPGSEFEHKIETQSYTLDLCGAPL